MSRSYIRLIMPGLTNLGMLDPEVYCMGWPSGPEGYETMKAMGIKTRINFRSMHSDEKECDAVGIVHIAIPMTVLDPIPIEMMRGVIYDLSTDPNRLPLVAGCASGQDRTGYWRYCYRRWTCGWTHEEAQAEMLAYITQGDFELWPAIRGRIEEVG